MLGEKARQQRATMYLANLLEGDVAGVHVAATYGSNDPLYVVDGVPVDPDSGGMLASVNPYDVESITVLKAQRPRPSTAHEVPTVSLLSRRSRRRI